MAHRNGAVVALGLAHVMKKYDLDGMQCFTFTGRGNLRESNWEPELIKTGIYTTLVVYTTSVTVGVLGRGGVLGGGARRGGVREDRAPRFRGQARGCPLVDLKSLTSCVGLARQGK